MTHFCLIRKGKEIDCTDVETKSHAKYLFYEEFGHIKKVDDKIIEGYYYGN